MFGCDTYVCDAAHVSALTITTKKKKPYAQPQMSSLQACENDSGGEESVDR